MAFERPTLEKLIRRGKADVNTRLTGADANLRGSPEEVLVIAEAGMTHGAHGHLKWLSRQLLADTCDDEFLVRLAGVWGLSRNPAVKSTGALTIVGVDTSTCPAGTIWVRGDGVQYTQDADVTITGGEAVAALTAVVGGVDGDADAGTKLQIGSAVTGITATATVSGTDGLSDGTDVETIADLRARLLERLRLPPRGGGTGDYVKWLKEDVSGVTRVWEYPVMLGPGTVGVCFVRDDDVSIIPDAGEVTTAQTAIDAHRPITAEVTVFAPVPEPVDFVFAFLDPDTSDVRAAITAELEALIADCAPEGQDGDTMLLSKINEAISIANGENDHVLTTPAGDVTPAVGGINTMGTITWPV